MSRRFKNYRLKDHESAVEDTMQKNLGIKQNDSQQVQEESEISQAESEISQAESEISQAESESNQEDSQIEKIQNSFNESEFKESNQLSSLSGEEQEEKGIELPAPDSKFEEILIVKDLVKVYNKNKENEVKALKGISFTVKKGEMVSIMGPSGSGKSTLLHLLGALDSPTSGEIFIGNRAISKMSESELTKFRRMQVGFVFQYYNLIPTLSALENVELPMVLAGVPKKKRIEQAKYMLELVGLKERMNNKPNQMSGGQMQRVAIARALANHPSIVLADEPTGNLDTKTGEEIMELFKKLNREYNQTFIIVTHDPKIAAYTKKTFHILDGLLDYIELRTR